MPISIPERHLEPLAGKTLFYPCAGTDLDEPIRTFFPAIKEFWFCDLHYAKGLRLDPILIGDPSFQLVDQEKLGDPNFEKEERADEEGRKYGFMLPSVLRETYCHTETGERFVVNRRRGYAQYALSREFQDRSIGVFIHRGDSPGEAGSNVYFLANMNSRHAPIGRLFDKLSEKLADTALIVSDGSNCRIRQLKKYLRTRITGPEAFAQIRGKTFCKWHFHWECVGYMSAGCVPTLVWRVSRL